MRESDHIVAEMAARIFADFADPQTINRAKDGAWRGPLWRALSEAGLPLAWVPEQLGGSGASLLEGFAVLGAAGRFAVAVPLAETYFETGLVPRLPTAVLAIGLIILGFLSFLAGLILDVVATMRSEIKRLTYLSYPPVAAGRN